MRYHERVAQAIAETIIPRGGPFEMGGVDVPIAERLETMTVRLGYRFGPVKALIVFLDWVPVLLLQFSRLTRMRPEKREAFVAKLASSRWIVFHGLFELMKMLVVTIFYSDPAAGAAIGYPGDEQKKRLPSPGPTAARTTDHRPLTTDHLTADVVVIGSGPGGGVVAKTLAEAGAKVVILERGGDLGRVEHGESITEGALRTLGGSRAIRFHLAHGLPPMPIFTGRCVGGSAALNAGTSFRLPESIRQKWVTQHHLEIFKKPYLDSLNLEIEDFLNIREVEPEVIGGNGRVFRRGIEALGFSGGPTKRNARGCKGAGMCVPGCPNDAKLSPQLSWIPAAVKAGSTLVKHCRVERVIMKNGRATGVEAVITPRRGALQGAQPGGVDAPPTQRGAAERLRVEARTIVLAAGAFNTPVLLWKSGVNHRAIGRNLRVHPGVVAGAIFDEDVSCWRGTPQPYYSDQFLDDKGCIFLVGAIPPVVGSVVIPGWGREHKEWMARYRGFTDGGALISDSSTGRIVRLPGGRTQILYFLPERDRARMQEALEWTCRIYFAGGAKVVFPGIIGARAVRDEAELRREMQNPISATRMIGGSVHPMCTCVMGVDPEESVVDSTGKVHGTQGLYIADGSILPTCTIVNPQQAIMSVALHVAKGLLK